MPRGMNNLDKDIDCVLRGVRYKSALGRNAALQERQIDAIKADLLPFIQDVVRRSNWLHTKADNEVFLQEYHGEWQNP